VPGLPVSPQDGSGAHAPQHRHPADAPTEPGGLSPSPSSRECRVYILATDEPTETRLHWQQEAPSRRSGRVLSQLTAEIGWAASAGARRRLQAERQRGIVQIATEQHGDDELASPNMPVPLHSAPTALSAGLSYLHSP
jgi:hypothetical protein